MADRRSKPEIQLVSSDDEVRERMLSYVWLTVHLIRVAVFTDLLNCVLNIKEMDI